MKHTKVTRVLALDLHPRSFGYVVVESSNRLLDWGVCSSRQKANCLDVLARRRLRPLLEQWRPSLLVLHNPRGTARRRDRQMDRFFKRIATEAKNHGILVRSLKKRPREGQAKRLTKYENARRVAERFPVLRRNLPPKRRAWESEDYRMSMFTAVGLAMAYDSSVVPPRISPPILPS